MFFELYMLQQRRLTTHPKVPITNIHNNLAKPINPVLLVSKFDTFTFILLTYLMLYNVLEIYLKTITFEKKNEFAVPKPQRSKEEICVMFAQGSGGGITLQHHPRKENATGAALPSH